MSTSTDLIAQAKQLLNTGQFQQAISQCKSILNKQPSHLEALYIFAVSCRYLNRYDQAQSIHQKILAIAPDYGRVYQEQGHCFQALNQKEQALEAYKTAVKFNPALRASWQSILILSHTEADKNIALTNIEYLSKLPPVLVSVISFIHEKKLTKAEKLCRHFLLENPKHTEAMRLLANIAEKIHVLDDAEFLLESCLEYEPDNHWARFDYINVLHRRQKFAKAHQQACLLAESIPNEPSVLIALANQKAAIGEFEQAISMYESLEKREPDNALIPLLKGHALKTLGEQDKAIQSYLKAITLNPQFGDAYWSLANLKTFQFSEQLIQSMRKALETPHLRETDTIQLHFALAKALEDAKEFKQSFAHYQQGNALKKQLNQYNSSEMLEEFEKQRTLFTPDFVRKKTNYGYPSEAPIFIVGLPRAGSTLLEQILSSHSQIDGTLELPNILSYVHELSGRRFRGEQSKYPMILEQLSPEDLRAYGERYIEETKVYRQGAPYFIDKMPNNFRHIGLIKMILPQAKIIDARRNGMACCFSAYKQLFAEGQEFSYDLKDLGDYYRGYCDLMKHWHTVFPGQILTVQYENVVNSTQQEIEKIFQFLGLELEPSCLEFHKTKRPVRTASSEQVRQPIYQKGLAQWQHFEPFLGELKKALYD